MGSSRKSPGQAREWVGGRALAPVWVGTDEPRRPEIVLWVELPSELVVGCTLTDPVAEPVPFARTLREAIAHPMAGTARRPSSVRVAAHDLAVELRAELGDELPVVVAATPEFDRVLADFARSLEKDGEGEEPSYLEGGAVSPEAVAKLFADAAILWTIAPWKVASDDQVLRVDIPSLGVEGACVSIIGALGESIGILIFPSLEAFEGFGVAVEEAMGQAPPLNSPLLNMGTSLLSLTFERGAELPRSLRREVSSHGWRVAAPEAYPRVEHRDPDGVPRVLCERDVAIAAACAGALPAFFVRHREFFADDAAEPVCESYTGDDGVRVRISAPYEAGEWFEEEPPPSPQPRAVGRNAPCPCGSGKKYKRCHLPLEQAARAAAPRPGDLHALDRRVVESLLRFAAQRLPREFAAYREDFEDAEASLQISQHWAVWHFRVAGKSVAEHFLEERASRLSPEERAWIASQRKSWLSIWQVTAVDPGSGLDLLDLLTGEKRHVREVAGSHGRALRDALLARVVDHEGVSLLCGTHPQPLPPREAAAVVGAMRARLRRRGAVPMERLREEPVGRHLISRWEQEVAALVARAAKRPELVNTEGDPILLTVDEFGFDPGARAELGARLAALDGVDAQPPSSREREYVFLRPQQSAAPRGRTVWGRALLGARGLRLETNSVRRADELRERVESAAGALLVRRARTHEDPQGKRAQELATRDAPPPPSSPEQQRILREWKEQYYADWLDQPVPALAGKSPRQASRTRPGRERVALLLDELENLESRADPAERLDVETLRKQLKLD